MQISDERLAELTQLYAKEQEDAKPWVGEASVEADVHAALMELAALRRPVVQSGCTAEVDEEVERIRETDSETCLTIFTQEKLDSSPTLREWKKLATHRRYLLSSLDAAQREIQQLKAPPEERRKIPEAQQTLMLLADVLNWAYRNGYHEHGYDLVKNVEYQIRTWREYATRLRNAHDDRVRMLGFVQDELTARNKECVELRGEVQRITERFSNAYSAHTAMQSRAIEAEQRIERLKGAVQLLLTDIESYEAWERPCHAVDVARSALAAADGQQQNGTGDGSFLGMKVIVDPSMPADEVELRSGSNSVRVVNLGTGDGVAGE